MGTSRFIGKAYLERYVPPGGAAATTVSVNGTPVSFGQLTGGTLFIFGVSLTATDVFEVTYLDVYVENTLRQGIEALFKKGEQGMWYDPSDLSTLFQDFTALTPVTTLETPVGLILDKRHNLALGPDVLNGAGSFTSAVGWTVHADTAITGGKLVFTARAPGQGAAWTGGVQTSKIYMVTLTVDSMTGGNMLLYLGNGVNKFISGAGTYRFPMLCSGDTTVRLYANATLTAVVDDLTIQLIDGNHAHQPTAASRPILSARKNFISNSEDFSRSTWPTFHTKGLPGRLEEVAASGVHYIYEIVSAVANGVATISCDFKRDQRDFVWMYIGSSANAQVVFNLVTGAVIDVSGTGAPSATITPLGDGWYRCTVTATAPAGVNCGCGVSNSATIAAYMGVAGYGVFATKFQAERGPRATTYQRAGSRNLLTRTEDITNSIWAKNGVTVLDATTATYVSTGYVLQAVTGYAAVIGEKFTFSVDTDHPAPGSATFGGASPGGTDVLTSASLGGGWYRHTVTRTFNVTVTGTVQCIFYGGVTGAGTYRCTRMQGEGGPVTPYQRVDIAANNYDWAFPHYLKFDGVDDCLFTPNDVDFSGTDALTVAFTADSVASAPAGLLFEHSAAANSTDGAFYVSTNESAPGATTYRLRGQVIAGGGFLSAADAVGPTLLQYSLTSSGTTPATQAIARLRGVEKAINYIATPTSPRASFGVYPFYIGRRGNASTAAAVSLYPTVIRNAAATPAQLVATARYLAHKSGATLS